MTRRLPIPVIFALAAALAAAPAAFAQNPVCTGISEAADSDGSMTTVQIASGLVKPLFATAPPTDVERVFIIEQDGRIRIVKNGMLLAASFLDISGITRSPLDGGGDEEGLLGMAFHPNYATNGFFFVYHTDNTGANNVIARYTRNSTNHDLADSTSRVVVKSTPHPTFSNHNGGMIAFSPKDGKLYIGTGDGGASCDFFNAAQNLTDDRGKLLRLSVDTLPATNPSDNPFIGGGTSADDDVWSYGLRNPWRFSFDRDPDYDGDGTRANFGDIYIGDVGQNAWEEINYRQGTSTGGENYGWDHYEGTHCPNPSCGGGNCAIANVLPVLQYQHVTPDCNSVTGGYVYRGCRMPDVRGVYYYGEYCKDFIKTFRISGGVVTDERDRAAELQDPNGDGTKDIQEITSFGEDARAEIYVVDRGTRPGSSGSVWKIVPRLPNLEVSGKGATPFLLEAPGVDGDGDGTVKWTWEDLKATSSHPITSYRVYKNVGNGSGGFDCAFEGPDTFWVGGDPATPASGGLFSYIVVGRNAAGTQTSPGKSSAGVTRTINPGGCPP